MMMGRGHNALITPGMLRTLIATGLACLFFAGVYNKHVREVRSHAYASVPLPVITASDGRLQIKGMMAAVGGAKIGPRDIDPGHMPVELIIVPPKGSTWRAVWSWSRNGIEFRQPYQIVRHGYVPADDVGEVNLPGGLTTAVLFNEFKEIGRPDRLTVTVYEVILAEPGGKGAVTLEPTTYNFTVS